MKAQSILIVDDNIDLGEGLRSVLDDEGFDVSLASSISISRKKSLISPSWT